MQPTPSVPRVAVIGGGVTGLTAAWHLERAGLRAVVFERSTRVGGAVGTLRRDGWLHELGPNSLLEGSPTVASFIEAAGLGPRRVYAAPEAQNRYIVRGGKLVPMPTSPGRFATTPLFSFGAKIKLLGEPFRARGAADADESVADFVVRRLGREFLDYAVNPFVGGVYAGDPRRLSVRHGFPKLRALEQEHGSLIRGALARRNASGGPKGRMFTFPEGLEELPRSLAGQLAEPVRTGVKIRVVRRHDETWRIEYTAADGSAHSADFSAVICALPADALAGLGFEGVPHAERLGALREIEHPAVVSVFTGYSRSDVAHPLDGFGALVPEVEQGKILGTLFSSTLFPGRAPEGHVALTSFVGGTRQPDVARLEDAELLQVVRTELGRLVGARGEPAFVHLQRWPRAIPQYTIGYGRFKDAIASVEAGAPGLFIGGNCRDGISLANCLDSGHRLANAAQGAALRTMHPTD